MLVSSKTELRSLRKGLREEDNSIYPDVFPVDGWRDLERTRIQVVSHAQTQGLLLKAYDDTGADTATEDLL